MLARSRRDLKESLEDSVFDLARDGWCSGREGIHVPEQAGVLGIKRRPETDVIQVMTAFGGFVLCEYIGFAGEVFYPGIKILYDENDESQIPIWMMRFQGSLPRVFLADIQEIFRHEYREHLFFGRFDLPCGRIACENNVSGCLERFYGHITFYATDQIVPHVYGYPIVFGGWYASITPTARRSRRH